jgi:hypothetical protein
VYVCVCVCVCVCVPHRLQVGRVADDTLATLSFRRIALFTIHRFTDADTRPVRARRPESQQAMGLRAGSRIANTEVADAIASPQSSERLSLRVPAADGYCDDRGWNMIIYTRGGGRQAVKDSM